MNPQKHFILNLQSVVMNRVITAWKANFAVVGHIGINICMNTPPETVPLDRTNGAARPLKWCMVTADMVH